MTIDFRHYRTWTGKYTLQKYYSAKSPYVPLGIERNSISAISELASHTKVKVKRHFPLQTYGTYCKIQPDRARNYVQTYIHTYAYFAYCNVENIFHFDQQTAVIASIIELFASAIDSHAITQSRIIYKIWH